ncbi:MAG: dihydroorotate dehydrogenase electron transfer subunit [Erysipelotrichaceae bacterium]|nr:dihydroorotate dehydrogenase electron transfer subunit [Erysipelotrichaceae bacterium]
MEEKIFTIIENKLIARNTYQMKLKGEDLSRIRPGQFVNVKLEGFFLRRPISVCNVEDDVLTLIYKKVGSGTEVLSQMKEGKLNVLSGLGNGYDLSMSGDKPLLIGGGVGVPPLYFLARRLRKEGKKITVILGFNTKDEIFMKEDFEQLGCHVIITTVDGSKGHKGFVTDVMEDLDYSYFYTCGPLPMLKAVYAKAKSEGQFSLEERMGCGFGACMGCTIKVKGGYKRVCKEGPVFVKEELPWQE